MEPLLRAVLGGIFMVELKTRIVPTLENMVLNWKKFIDDTIGYINNGSIDIILSKLNSFYPNTQFTYDVEKEKKVIFGRSTNQKQKC